jgi:hypothetical protein
LSAKLKLAVRVPVPAGVNDNCKVTLLPAATVMGAAGGLSSANSAALAPVMAGTELMTRLALPVLVIVTDWVSVPEGLTN